MTYSSLKKLAPYLYEVKFDTLPEQGSASTLTGGCSSYVKNGKLYRNFDWNYDERATFHVKCKDFEGMGAIDGLNDSTLDESLIGQLPYHLADGRNKYGIMVSEHVLFNDWNWQSAGETEIETLPYYILSNMRTMDEIEETLENVLNNLHVPGKLSEMGYLLQFLVTDGEKTVAILPPESEEGAYVIVDISDNPKMSNFRWTNKKQVLRTELQTRPNGVKRWNAMPTDLENLRFTVAYEAPTRLSEFIGIDGTTKESTDAELTEIYNSAHEIYLTRTRNGETWQTAHSVVYSAKGLEELYVQEDWTENFARPEPDITESLLRDIEIDLDITWHDHSTDRKISNYIKEGMAYLNDKYGGKADYISEGFPRTLLFEYVRYRRDAALDVFENNYTSMILAMQTQKAVKDLYENMENT